MKKFSFRLQKLLNFENGREEREKMKLHSLVNHLRGQEKILNFLQDSLRQNQKSLAGKENVSTDSERLMLRQNYIVALSKRIEYQTEKVNQAVAEVDNEKNDILNIQKGRKMLEKLRDNDREEYNVEMSKTEIKQQDDTSASRQFMKTGG